MRYSKQDICKASVKYIISIGDDDEWWRLQPHRSVSNEWTSKPGSWIYLKVEKSPENLIDLRKNNSFAINWQWHDPERFYWKTLLNYENGHFAKRTIHNETDPRSLYSGYWLTCSECNGTFCLPNSPRFPASNNWENGQHSFIKNASLSLSSEWIAFIFNPARCCDQQERKLQMWWIRFLSHICN